MIGPSLELMKIRKDQELFNVNKLSLDATEKQLNDWGVKYHNLIMGKPYADYYIDNKAVDVLDWV